MLGGVADRIAHVTEPAAIDKVDDQFQLVHALEIGDLGLIARVNQRLKAGLDQFADSAAQNGLLTEKVGLRFLAKVGLDHSAARGPDRGRVGQRTEGKADQEAVQRFLAAIEPLDAMIAPQLLDAERHLFGRRLFEHLSGVHYDDVIGHPCHDAQVVGDQDDAGTGLGLKILDQF